MQAKLRIAGSLVQLTPSCKELVARHLTYKRREQEGLGADKVKYTEVKLYRDEGHCLIFPYGCMPRIVDVLKQHKVEVTVEDLRERRLPDPDYSELPLLRKGQDEVIVALTVNDWGVIEAPTGMGKTFLIVQICKMWPTARVLITSPLRAINKMTYERLRKIYPPHEIGLVDGTHCQRDRRIVCTTADSMLKVDLEKIDILIVDEVHAAASPERAKRYAQLTNARRYGFSASPYGRSDNADMETEALFGPTLLKFTYQDAQETGSVVPVEVKVFSTDSVPILETQSEFVLKRHGLWQNTARHLVISEAVGWAFTEYGPDIQILILVDTIEHGLRLNKVLPDFELVYGSMKKEDVAYYQRLKLLPDNYIPLKDKDKDNMRRDFECGKLRKVIATTTWGTGVDFPYLNVLVRAEVSSGEIASTQYPGRITRPSEDKQFGVVIDFDDTFSTALASKAQRRFASYRRKGWTVHLPKHTPITNYQLT